jgi:hypothetical protein
LVNHALDIALDANIHTAVIHSEDMQKNHILNVGNPVVLALTNKVLINE